MITENKHTPGEWTVKFMGGQNQDDGENQFFVHAPNNNRPDLAYGIEIMMDDSGDHNGYPREQKLADAYLIASAPRLKAENEEMLAMLLEAALQIEYLQDKFKETDGGNTVLNRVFSLIAEITAKNRLAQVENEKMQDLLTLKHSSLSWIPLDEKQEEALGIIHQSLGFDTGLAVALKLLENKLGQVHYLTIELRKELSYGKGKELRDKASLLNEESKLNDLLFKRL